MKKMLTLLIALLLAAMLTCAMAEDEPTVYTSGDYKYILLEDGTAEITDYTGKATKLAIPEELDGYRVTAIGEYAFSYNSSLTSVSIPNSVTAIGANPFRYCKKLTSISISTSHPTLAVIDGVLFEKSTKTLICYPCTYTAKTYAIPQGIQAIGDDAFAYCKFLTSVSISDSVTSIGESAFLSCSSLSSIYIPNSVIAIGANPFSSCNKLTSISVSPDHPTLATIGGVLFEKSTKALICYPCALTAKSYTIPQGIQTIGNEAFAYCFSLTSISIPDSVSTIGESAFSNCGYLTSIPIPKSTTSIGDSAFSGCSSLTSISIPDSITIIGKHMFYNCLSLTIVSIPNSVTVIGERAFYSCRSLTSVSIPDSVVSIGGETFANCPNATLTVGRDSYARQYAIDNGLKYTYPDANDWLFN